MDAFALRAFQRDVALQCKIALIAAGELEAALSEIDRLIADSTRAMDEQAALIRQSPALYPVTAAMQLREGTIDEEQYRQAVESHNQEIQRNKGEIQARKERVQLNLEKTREVQDRAWAAIQALLVASANIAKLIWPAQKPRGYPSWNHNRFPDLRDSLGVDDTWLLKQKDLRNIFEHYDEYLDRLGSADNPGNLMADLTISDSDQAIVGFPTKALYRSFNPQTWDLHFWDKSLSLKELVTELQRLIRVAQPLADKPRRL